MNLNIEMLKKLISEAIDELSENQPEQKPAAVPSNKPAGKEGLKDLETVEQFIRDELTKYLEGTGSGLKKRVMNAAGEGKPSRVKARILTVIADSFGISAAETRQDLSSAGDQLKGK